MKTDPLTVARRSVLPRRARSEIQFPEELRLPYGASQAIGAIAGSTGKGRGSYLPSGSPVAPVTDAVASPQYRTARAGYGVGRGTGPEVVWR